MSPSAVLVARVSSRRQWPIRTHRRRKCLDHSYGEPTNHHTSLPFHLCMPFRLSKHQTHAPPAQIHPRTSEGITLRSGRARSQSVGDDAVMMMVVMMVMMAMMKKTANTLYGVGRHFKRNSLSTASHSSPNANQSSRVAHSFHNSCIASSLEVANIRAIQVVA